ncbi:MAG: hypothetical protein ACETWQ_04030 [Phycisphaerae bacterium]
MDTSAGLANGWGPIDSEWTAYIGTGAVTSLLTVHVIQDGEVYSLTFDAKETAGGHILLWELYADLGIERIVLASALSSSL